jgi:hypothetical protein
MINNIVFQSLVIGDLVLLGLALLKYIGDD